MREVICLLGVGRAVTVQYTVHSTVQYLGAGRAVTGTSGGSVTTLVATRQ